MTDPDRSPEPAAQDEISLDALAAAAEVIGLHFTQAERELMREDVQDHREHWQALRAVPLDNSVPPAFGFDPRPPGLSFETPRQPFRLSAVEVPPLPADLEEVAFWPVTHLAHLVRTQQVTAVALTEMYLARLKRYDPVLHCVITLTEDLAMQQARRADAEIARGHYRGPLHGIPWGAKDLLAVQGYPTTWGAQTHRDQVIDLDATVVQRLEAAGAVLVGKLSLGALAWGDVWFGEKTRSPWDVNEGSSGSSAGSAAATTAGLVGFSLGSETLGSIVSPCTECRATGLRPTFGRVSRHGAMALSWTMDKIGPICRTVEDCALVFDAIRGPDDLDPAVTDYAFNWQGGQSAAGLRVGYLKSAFDEDHDGKPQDDQTLDVLRGLGFDLVPMALPDFPEKVYEAVVSVLEPEAAAYFDELTRSDRDDLLTRQVKDAWPNAFRQARLIPAVEYIQANRVRTLMIRQMVDIMADIDVFVAPSFGGHHLILTNLTGHPAVVVPNGVTDKGKSSSVTFTGRLYGEVDVLAVAKAYQDATDFHRQRPSIPLE